MAGDNPREITEEFKIIQEQNTRTTNNTLSFVLSPTIEDGKNLSSEQLQELTQRFIVEMKLAEHQGIGFGHRDKKHTHVHVYVNRINSDGTAYKDNFIGKRSQYSAERVAKEMGLTTAREVQHEKLNELKKMEEMMELLTEEIEGFHKSISMLEDLSKDLNNLKIKADTSSIEYNIKGFLKEQRKAISIFKERTSEIKQDIKSARITPNWLATPFCLIVTIQVLSMSYFAYQFIQFEDRNKAAYLEGQKESNESARGYFKDHSIIYEDFKKWNRKKDSVPNQK